jgi:hypothetical protein
MKRKYTYYTDQGKCTSPPGLWRKDNATGIVSLALNSLPEFTYSEIICESTSHFRKINKREAKKLFPASEIL